MKTEGFLGFRENAARTAKQLLYGIEVVEKIRNAQSEGEIERILVTARKKRTEAEDAANDIRIARKKERR